MAEKYPKDRFDEIPDDVQRVGAHRSPRKGRGWVAFGWAALATVVLVGIGVIGLFAANGTINFSDPLANSTATATATGTPTPTPVPTVNPALNVAVLNGTTQDGLATAISAKLTAAGWKVGSTADASLNNLTQTVIYYSEDANVLAAEAMAKELPGSTIAKTQVYADTGADLTVVLGSDTKVTSK